MTPGDLVEVTQPCTGMALREYELGQVGIVLGPANDPHNAGLGCISILFGDGIVEDFSDRMIQVISTRGRRGDW